MPEDPTPLHMIVLAVRFAVELAAFAALGVWGAETGASTPASVLLAVAAPMAAIALWGTFAAPRAPRRQQGGRLVAVEALVFGAAVLGLLGVGRHAEAVVLGVVALVDTALAHRIGAGR